MNELYQFVAFVAAVTVVVGVIICSLCALKALQFIAEERRAGGPRLRGRRGRRRALSPHVPLEPIRRSLDGPIDTFDETELDRRRALREEWERRGPGRPGC